ncbi:unnamed protein product [Caenorhabditis sp. 36 PRJEB53466]|nr:unnamed protein product [Caenorhabditis sp. 36 PRJEB53466]
MSPRTKDRRHCTLLSTCFGLRESPEGYFGSNRSLLSFSTMRFFAAVLLLAFVLIATFDVSAAQSRIDRSAAWSRLGGSRLLPRRMYRSLPSNDYQAVWEKLADAAETEEAL